MNIGRTNIVLAVLLLVVVLVATSKVNYSQPNFEFLPEMKRSPASAAYEVSAVLPAGRTLQPPVSGTIARGELPLYYSATKEDAARAGEEIQNPYTNTLPVLTVVVNAEKKPVADKPVVDLAGSTKSTKKPTAAELQIQRLQVSIERGAKIYRISCIPCHGPSGAGDGVVSKRGFPPPPPLTTGKSALMKDGQLFHILTYGQGSMSPMVAQLSRDRRWDVINFVRDLQQKAAKSAKLAPITATKPNQSSDTKEAKQ